MVEHNTTAHRTNMWPAPTQIQSPELKAEKGEVEMGIEMGMVLEMEMVCR